MNWNVLKSIFKRDFVSYFSNPTGYVFICVFVVLSALATFWPPEFFSNNLANLDQLSHWLPFIMLVFIPAITMSMWAEERHQGTDELLLTIPASDFDVVLGKYLAAVAIFTVSLLFSAFSIFLVFNYGLGSPDFGLYVSTYVGYWFIGIGMISIGMVASFITTNLTVGFILGMLLNLPLALFGVADWIIKDPGFAQEIRRWSALEQFRDFQAGVISLGGMTYFITIAAVMLYLSMILIGQRHWRAREQGRALSLHFLVRTIALAAIAVSLTAYAHSHNRLRMDISSEQLSSLSGDTLALLKQIREDDAVQTIKIDAYVSPQVPTEYAARKLDFLSALQEFQALGGGKIVVNKHEIPNYGPEALLAEKNYGITPQAVYVVEESEQKREELFLGAAVTSGPDRIVIPFFGKGIPVEYELIRSIMTVSNPKRLRLGVIDTGLPLMGFGNTRRNEFPLITELRKQYDVDDRPIDLSRPIKEQYDVLLAVQPSMLEPLQMDHFVDAIRDGIPTVILEDTMPYFYPPQYAVGTSQPRFQDPRMAMYGMPSAPKGDIEQLWRLLGVQVFPNEVIWQKYNPDRTIRSRADPQWIFIDQGNGAAHAFNPDNPISAGLNQVLLVYPGSLVPDDDSPLVFEQLAVTGEASGTVDVAQLNPEDANYDVFGKKLTRESYILAAQIHGTLPEDDQLLTDVLKKQTTGDEGSDDTTDADDGADAADETDASDEVDAADAANEADAADAAENAEEDSTDVADTGIEIPEQQVNVAVVMDIDWIIPDFFTIRQRGDQQILPTTQNVTFILNLIDHLAGEDRFLEIRKRTRIHRTLTKIDEATRDYREESLKKEKEFVTDIMQRIEEAKQSYQQKVDEVDQREGLSDIARRQLKERVEIEEGEILAADINALNGELNRTKKQNQYELKQKIRAEEDFYKFLAILIPPIPPLLLALFVFFRRRSAEREGVAKERLR